MNALGIARDWDRALRLEDYDRVRAILAPDATWHGTEPDAVCRNADEIVETMRENRSRAEPPEVRFEDHAGAVVAHLRFRDGAPVDELYQVITVDAGRIVRIDDYATRPEALAAV